MLREKEDDKKKGRELQKGLSKEDSETEEGTRGVREKHEWYI